MALVERYKRVIYKVCYMYAPDAGQVDDYFQEVVLALWRGFGNFRGESKVSTWVYRVALNTCLTFVRRRMLRPRSVHLAVDLACDDDAALREQLDELYAVIGRLGGSTGRWCCCGWRSAPTTRSRPSRGLRPAMSP